MVPAYELHVEAILVVVYPQFSLQRVSLALFPLLLGEMHSRPKNIHPSKYIAGIASLIEKKRQVHACYRFEFNSARSLRLPWRMSMPKTMLPSSTSRSSLHVAGCVGVCFHTPGEEYAR